MNFQDAQTFQTIVERKDNEERVISMGKEKGESKRTANGEECGKKDD